MPVKTFSAVIHKENNLYVAQCPEVGVVSQGATLEEALANLREATELYLEEFQPPEESQPLLTTFRPNMHKLRQVSGAQTIRARK